MQEAAAVFIKGPIDDSIIQETNNKWTEMYHIGASAWFLGQVRADVTSAGTVTAIEYSAHESMAVKEFKKIIEEIEEKTSVNEIVIRHSLGPVPAGELCLIVGVAGGHRKEVFAALESTVDEIKARVPIYGKEHIGSGNYQWKENR